jgi:hypothetical protein
LPAGGRKPERQRFTIQIRPGHAAFSARRSGSRVNTDAVHRRKIDDKRTIGDRRSGHIVTAATNGDRQVMIAREPDRGQDIGDLKAAGDHRRMAVDHPVPDLTRRIVRRIDGKDQRATQFFTQSRNVIVGKAWNVEFSDHAPAPSLIRKYPERVRKNDMFFRYALTYTLSLVCQV